MLPRNLGKIRAVDNLVLELLTLILGVNENVSCRRFRHDGYPLFDDPLGSVRPQPAAEALQATLYREIGAGSVRTRPKNECEIVCRHRYDFVHRETVNASHVGDGIDIA